MFFFLWRLILSKQTWQALMKCHAMRHFIWVLSNGTHLEVSDHQRVNAYYVRCTFSRGVLQCRTFVYTWHFYRHSKTLSLNVSDNTITALCCQRSWIHVLRNSHGDYANFNTPYNERTTNLQWTALNKSYQNSLKMSKKTSLFIKKHSTEPREILCETCTYFIIWTVIL